MTAANQQAGLPVAAASGYGYRGQGALGDVIRYVLALVRRNLLVILGVLASTLVASVTFTMLQTPIFTAQTEIQINDQGDQVLGNELDATNIANVGWDTERFLNTQLDIVKSRGLALRVADKLHLLEDRKFFEAMQAEQPGRSVRPEVKREQVVKLLRHNMTIELPESSRIATISFSSSNSEVSARIANAFAEEFIQSNLQRRFDSSAYARGFVSEQLDEAKVRLENSERALNAYAREAGLIRQPSTPNSQGQEQSSVTAASLMQLNEAASAAQARRAEAEAKWTAELAAPLLSSQVVLANPTVQSLMTKRSTIASDLQDARSRYLPNHPAVSRLESELAGVERQLDRAARQVRDSVQAEFAAARAAEDGLKQRVQQLQSATMAEQDRSVRYNILAREADTNRSLYDGLLQRYRELNAAAGIASSNVAIIDRADPPLTPSSPNPLKNLLIGLVGGIAIAGLVVFLRDQLDDRIRVPEDVEEKIQVPLLGVIPLDAQLEPLGSLDDPKSPLSEAYNSLRGSLFHATSMGLPKVLLVTSAQPSEGKTTTCFAIARSMALAGKRALLMDADLRRPSLHRVAKVENTVGLSTLLTSSGPVSSVTQNSDDPNLSFIPSGPIPQSPTELLSSPRMAALLEEAARDYDVVIVDCAPVLGLADSPLLSAIVDGVLLVVEADRGRGGALKTAIRRLRSMNPVILGAVLTKFDAQSAGNRYSEYYGYEYYRYSQADS